MKWTVVIYDFSNFTDLLLHFLMFSAEKNTGKIGQCFVFVWTRSRTHKKSFSKMPFKIKAQWVLTPSPKRTCHFKICVCLFRSYSPVVVTWTSWNTSLAWCRLMRGPGIQTQLRTTLPSNSFESFGTLTSWTWSLRMERWVWLTENCLAEKRAFAHVWVRSVCSL